MPIHPSRFGDPNDPQERLPGDHGVEIDWVCPNCQTSNRSIPAQGCSACGAGRPGEKVTLPPTLEELQGGGPSGTEVQGGSTPPRSTKEPLQSYWPTKILMSGGADNEKLLQDVRMIVREELRDVLGKPAAPVFTDKERFVLLEGIKLAQFYLQAPETTEEERAQFPSAEDLLKLYQQIAGE